MLGSVGAEGAGSRALTWQGAPEHALVSYAVCLANWGVIEKRGHAGLMSELSSKKFDIKKSHGPAPRLNMLILRHRHPGF